jgi:hypothetical protein
VDFSPEENARKIIAYLDEHGYLLPAISPYHENGHQEEQVPVEEANA